MAKQHDSAAEHHPGKTHRDGIQAHVIIQIAQGVDVWSAHKAIKGIAAPGGVTLTALHVGLGEYDVIADIHAAWTDGEGGQRGEETARIGEWVNRARKKKVTGKLCIQRTSTLICMFT